MYRGTCTILKIAFCATDPSPSVPKFSAQKSQTSEAIPSKRAGPQKLSQARPTKPVIGAQGLQVVEGRGVASRVPAVEANQRPMTKVKFWLQFHAEYGQRVRVVGSHKNLGEKP